MTYDKKMQFGGWTKREFRYVRRKLERFWRKEMYEQNDVQSFDFLTTSAADPAQAVRDH
jgi:hypothetical protein